MFRIVFLVLTLFLLYEGATKGYWLGHEIFNPTAVEAEPGRMRTVTIEESESTSEAGEALERVGLIQSRVVFCCRQRFMNTRYIREPISSAPPRLLWRC